MPYRILLAASLVVLAGGTAAQVPAGPPARNQASSAGSAGVTAHMQSQGFSEIHNLHRGPDGKWTGQAVRNGVPYTVTAEPDGRLTPR
ncbi:hypothetical protein SAMN02745126_01120 [Enhydrobacter aerosaccus]|uniref:Peptidase propeptide and YPEB domain-containing protein n=1 Tax=Enhydrobacter aerosaccus TaxID=225324 RepID=A0A1T4KS05_9HYPH|nr:hypothetical protein [Enhydrobacter aerosaccus]SJZ45219.1 hypothetical protein SAMN02745126_01120 [Enhydrobacter aerosaccus]